ncbi:hypothetical protein DFH06DRAFT_1146470 [Mycena polygramma]|nr:hypothetical protein DFH06DRAFT_1146470 [Mycena polygramma]
MEGQPDMLLSAVLGIDALTALGGCATHDGARNERICANASISKLLGFPSPLEETFDRLRHRGVDATVGMSVGNLGELNLVQAAFRSIESPENPRESWSDMENRSRNCSSAELPNSHGWMMP